MTLPGACPLCGVTGYEPTLHRRWHEQLDSLYARLRDLDAGAALYGAHTENLIERTYALEEARHYHTKTGKVLTDADIEELADEAERGYDVRHLKERTRDAAHGA